MSSISSRLLFEVFGRPIVPTTGVDGFSSSNTAEGVGGRVLGRGGFCLPSEDASTGTGSGRGVVFGSVFGAGFGSCLAGAGSMIDAVEALLAGAGSTVENDGSVFAGSGVRGAAAREPGSVFSRSSETIAGGGR